MIDYREVSKVSGYGLDSTQLRTDTCVTSLCPCVLNAVCGVRMSSRQPLLSVPIACRLVFVYLAV